jgi:hypothetical protein
MIAKEVLKFASQELSLFMEAHEYRKRSVGDFVRTEETLEKCVMLTISKWSNGTGFHVDHYAAYRLPEHNRLLSGGQKEKELTPTISLYFLNFVPQGFNWNDVTVATESDIPTVARNIERICTLYSFPFLNRFATAEAIVEGFRGERASWAVQDPIRRHELLLIDAVLKRDQPSFNHWFDESLRFCGNRKDGRAVWLKGLAESLKKDYFQ